MVPKDAIWSDRAFRVMGTRARIVVRGDRPELAAAGEAALRALEARWTRFCPDSELMLLNGRSGRPVRVSEPLFAVVARAVDAWQRTDGRFDPTGLDAIIDVGYDRDFDRLGPMCEPLQPGHPLPGCAGIHLDPLVRTVELPRGVRLDLGGIGKGYAADRVVAELVDRGADSVCVDLGGDVRVVGPGPVAGAWEVAFADPASSEEFGSVRIGAGAVATSTITKRRWERDGRPVHHLIDPDTGTSSRSGVATATVIAADAWWAEALAKAALVAGPDRGPALLEQHDVDGALVGSDGSVTTTRGFSTWCTPGSDTPSTSVARR